MPEAPKGAKNGRKTNRGTKRTGEIDINVHSWDNNICAVLKQTYLEKAVQ